MKIAVFDEDPAQSNLLCEVLSGAGHACSAFSDADALLADVEQQAVDLLILGWQLERNDPTTIVARMRAALSPDLPVMFVTSRSNEDDILAGLGAGANDYLIKPVRRGELVARTQALLRRSYPELAATEQIRFGDYLFESRSGKLLMGGEPVDLTHKEFELSLLLFRNLGRPLSRAFILESVWARDPDVPSRTMDTHVSRVRSKLRLKPEFGFRLAPVYSYGYRLEQLDV